MPLKTCVPCSPIFAHFADFDQIGYNQEDYFDDQQIITQ